MADQCLQAGVIETTGALSAIGFPVLLLSVGVGFACGAHGESGLSLVLSGLQSVGFFRGSLAVIALPALGWKAAAEAVRITGVKGVTAGAVAAAAGATVSAITSTIIVAETARSIRAKQETAFESFIHSVGCGVLLGMGMSSIFGQRNRNGGGANRRSEDEEEDENHEINAEDENKTRRKKRRNKKKKKSVTDLKNII